MSKIKLHQYVSLLKEKKKQRSEIDTIKYHIRDTQDTTWESDKNTRKHHTQENQEVSPFQAGDHKAARNKQGTDKTV